MSSQKLRAFEFQKLPSVITPTIVSYLGKSEICGFSLTNKSNAILAMGRKREVQMAGPMKRRKKTMEAFGEKYGHPLLGRAIYTLITSESEDLKWYEKVLLDIKQILETRSVEEPMFGFTNRRLNYMNGLKPFEMVLYWAFVNRNMKPSTYTDDMVEQASILLVENGAGNIHDAINYSCVGRVRELIAEGADLNSPSWETVPWQEIPESSWLPLEHALDFEDREIIQIFAEEARSSLDLELELEALVS